MLARALARSAWVARQGARFAFSSLSPRPPPSLRHGLGEDEYAWTERADAEPDLSSYVEAENEFTNATMKPFESLEGTALI